MKIFSLLTFIALAILSFASLAFARDHQTAKGGKGNKNQFFDILVAAHSSSNRPSTSPTGMPSEAPSALPSGSKKTGMRGKTGTGKTGTSKTGKNGGSKRSARVLKQGMIGDPSASPTIMPSEVPSALPSAAPACIQGGSNGGSKTGMSKTGMSTTGMSKTGTGKTGTSKTGKSGGNKRSARALQGMIGASNETGGKSGTSRMIECEEENGDAVKDRGIQENFDSVNSGSCTAAITAVTTVGALAVLAFI